MNMITGYKNKREDYVNTEFKMYLLHGINLDALL